MHVAVADPACEHCGQGKHERDDRYALHAMQMPNGPARLRSPPSQRLEEPVGRPLLEVQSRRRGLCSKRSLHRARCCGEEPGRSEQVASSTTWEDAHGYEGSLGNDGSVRADERAECCRADVRPSVGLAAGKSEPSAAFLAFIGLRDDMGRPVARDDCEGAFALASCRISSWRLVRAPALGCEPSRRDVRRLSKTCR